jgi:hypothetical protein
MKKLMINFIVVASMFAAICYVVKETLITIAMMM